MTDAVNKIEQPREPTRRDFPYICTGMATLVGSAAFLWPVIDGIQPSADVAALASVEVDISLIEPGIKIKWRGKPVFIVHRTDAMVTQAREDSTGAIGQPLAALFAMLYVLGVDAGVEVGESQQAQTVKSPASSA